MNKFTKKIVGKFGIFAPVALAILVAGILVACIFGFNTAHAYDDMTTLTVSVTSYKSDNRVEAVEKVCEGALEEVGIRSYFHEVDVRTSMNSYDIVYCIENASEEDLATLKLYVETKIHNASEATGEDETALKGLEDFMRVTINEKIALRTATKHFALRASIAAVVLLAAAFVYVLLRHKLAAAVSATVIALLTLALTVALTAIFRMPFSTLSVGIWFIALVLGETFGTVTAAKMHETEKDKENEGLTAKELTEKGSSEKTLLVLSAAIALGVLLIGIMGISPVQWYALNALLALASALFTAGVLFPATYPAILEKLLVSRAKKRRYDYKKSAKKEKTVAESKEEKTSDAE